MTLPDDCVVRLIDLPVDVGGFITESPDGWRNIYINARYSNDGRREALRHELRHAENEDLHSEEDVAVIEARAEGSDPRLKAVPNLIRARDLQPPSPPPLKPAAQLLSSQQARILAGCLAELDRWMYREEYDY